ncbi:MAG: bifunctional hydroxymethylpyrimidine kinase/phosphomethylpyrimidine kinase [Bacteroidales bacterium]|nr:bifunctional hydroxymethylpyrimidine kinase/phosphomethylpyrimidine kinase [Bacteroidales bacterium]
MLLPPVLSITGSDGTGGAGIQADVQTITSMGCRAITAVTCLSVLNEHTGLVMHDVPTELVVNQVQPLLQSYRPTAAKIGLVRDAETIMALRRELAGIRHIVCDPGILSARGTRLIPDEAILTLRNHLLPLAELLTVRCNEAALLLGRAIESDRDMLQAAQQLSQLGPQWILMRGGRFEADRLTALLYGGAQPQFFSSHNVDGWMQHGVSGALSSAIAARLALGDDMEQAVSRAHEYMHHQVVYQPDATPRRLRPADLYDSFLDLLAQHHTVAHEVQWYADRMHISTRYLAQITALASGHTPKQVIDDYLVQKAKVLLTGSGLSIQETAYHLGFSSQAQFSRLFSHIEGQTPSQYRK